MNQEKLLDISWGTILKIAFIILVFYILYQISNILIWFVFALVISILFYPVIDFFEKLKIPRTLSVVFVYSLFFGALILIIYFTLPLFVSEIKQFSQILPQYFERISPPLKGLGIKAFEDIDSFMNSLGSALEKMVANVFNILFVIFGGIFATFFVLTLTFFLSLEKKQIERSISLLFPKKHEASLLAIFERCQRKVSGWFLTRIIACFFVGAISSIAFLFFNTPYPFVLGLLSGVLNFIPFVGPIATGILLFIILSLESLTKAIFVLITFILIQQVENNILTPFLSKKFVGLSPILVLMALTIGGTLLGFLGAVLAIPLAGILIEFLKEYFQQKREEKAVVL